MTIRSPLEWTGSQVMYAAHVVSAFGRSLQHMQDRLGSQAPAINKITVDDLPEVLARGWSDFAAYRTDVFFLVVIYPVLAVVLSQVAFGANLLPLLFPLASGFALIGPVAAVALYEMSRRREQGLKVSWFNGIEVFHRPAIGGIIVLAILQGGVFLLWQAAAWVIFKNTLGPVMPDSLGSFVDAVLSTPQGHQMIVIGMAVGFLFAVLAMIIGVVSFPLLIDRDTGIDTAVKTSIRAVMANKLPIAAWGLIVAFGLVLGSIPLFVGLIVVLPVLGHSTWHLYRKLVQR
jgi:uncharacterized membrane protein